MQSYDSSDDECTVSDSFLQKKKSTARRSLESQFSASDQQRSNVTSLVCYVDGEKSVPLRTEVQVSGLQTCSTDYLS